MEKGSSYLEKAVITKANENDRDQLEVIVGDKECMYVFDRVHFFLSRLRKTLLYRRFTTLNYPKTFADLIINILTHQ